MLVCGMVLATSCSNATRHFRIVKPEKFHSDYFAVWGERDGEPFEDRYDAMQCGLYENGNRIGDLIIYQHWFKKDRKEYPEIGSSVQIEICNLEQNIFNDTNGIYAVEADRFEEIRIQER